jgi:hypothetical protein
MWREPGDAGHTAVERLALIPGASLAWIGLVWVAAQIRSLLFPARGPWGSPGPDATEIALAVGLIVGGCAIGAVAWKPDARWTGRLAMGTLTVASIAMTRCAIEMFTDEDPFSTLGWSAGVLLLVPAVAALVNRLAEPVSEPGRAWITGALVGVGLATTTVRLVAVGAIDELSSAVPAAILLVAALLLAPEGEPGSTWMRIVGGLATVVAGALKLIGYLAVGVAAIGGVGAVVAEPQVGFEGASWTPALGAVGAIAVSVAAYSSGLLFARARRSRAGSGSSATTISHPARGG